MRLVERRTMRALAVSALGAMVLGGSAGLAQVRPATATPPAGTVTLPAGQVEEMRAKLADWPQLGRYRAENQALAPPAAGERRVVFFGSSTTDNWGRQFGSVFFPGKPYVNRGISGQTTPQMLVRFQQDVVALQPAAVVILAGTNDIAGNTGPSTLEMTADCLRSMVAVAEANGIRVILASQLPVIDFPWNKGTHPAARLVALSAWEKGYAEGHGLVYVDYYSALVGADGSFREGLSVDGVHPTAKGYEVMAPLVERGIAVALGRDWVGEKN